MAEYIKREDLERLLDENEEVRLDDVPSISIDFNPERAVGDNFDEYIRFWDIVSVLVGYYGEFARIPQELLDELYKSQIKVHGNDTK